MRLEDLTVALRPRQPWEAVDLGCTLVRRDYGRILLLWMITVVPVWAVLAVLLWEHPLWFGSIVWWLKPLYDRLPLYHLSRAAFGARPTLKETLRAWPGLWSRFLLSALIFRRLSFIRSFALPVWMLEGQRGKAVGKRLTALATDGGSSGAMLTWVFVKLEIAVWLGLGVLVSTFGPASGLPEWNEFFLNPEAMMETSKSQFWFSNLLYLGAVTMMEPFYVGGGFGLYLNSRIKIEGWDIELTFRRLAARLRPVMTAVILACGLLGALVGNAQEGEPKEEVKTALEEILAKPEFKEHTRTQRVWVPEEVDLGDGPTIGAGAGYVLGYLFYGVVILVVAVLLFLAVRWLVLNQHLFGFARRVKRVAEPAGPRVVMGMDIASESLPDDITAAARAAWAAGRLREALSLLYRGALSRLVEQQRLPIRDSDTEDDCLMKVADLGDAPVTEFFRALTMIWVRAAYAGEEAREGEFENLCRTWPFLAGATRGAKRPGLFPSTALLFILLLPWLGACSKGEWEDVTLDLGYKGKARTDPFLAAQQLLEEYGHETERKPSFKELPEAEGVVFVSGESGMPEARATQLLDWVADGGHAVYFLAGCAPYNDWSYFDGMSTFGYAGNEDRADPMLEKLGIEVKAEMEEEDLKEMFKNKLLEETRPKKKKKEEAKEAAPEGEKKKIEQPEEVPTTNSMIQLDGESYEVEFPSLHTMALSRELEYGESLSGSLKQATMLDLNYGIGRVTVISHARPFRNRYVDENDHARWLLALVGERAQEVHFITTLQSSFWNLLWNRAWMPLVGLALVTVVWLWLNMPRFGPLRQVQLHDTKHFAEHIGALGQFFYRLKRPDVLLSAAADAVRVKAARRHPYLLQQDDEAMIQFLVEATEMPVERIRSAFMSGGKPAAHEMVRRLQDLQSLKTALG
ncbi:uncharacterized protein DUF4129 [Prosthecobacter fusiformis]|uniref:Uncharacterized protein DUF4129 n=1 Tax=Prosthecobacter fusiformis TaxID=48464 RepID=A0A4R7RIU5_9BACT|nr:DUF4350 domain-containing protein [Prosthecobacter fusiformis]TDU63119.1 uncharacterized protein DUF4129 [Prosthecobacter fusiformis]